MTHLQQLRATLDLLGVPYTQADDPTYRPGGSCLNPGPTEPATVLTLPQGAGYNFFVCRFAFRPDGSIIEHAVLED